MSVSMPLRPDAAEHAFRLFQRVYGVPMDERMPRFTYVTNAIQEVLRAICEPHCSPTVSADAGRVITVGLSYLSIAIKRQPLSHCLCRLYSFNDFVLPFGIVPEPSLDMLRFYITDGLLHHTELLEDVPRPWHFLQWMYDFLMNEINSGSVYAMRSCSLLALFCRKRYFRFLRKWKLVELMEFAFHNLDNSYFMGKDTKYIFKSLQSDGLFGMVNCGVTTLPWKDRLKYIFYHDYMPPVCIMQVLSRSEIVRVVLSDAYLCPTVKELYEKVLEECCLDIGSRRVLYDILREPGTSTLQENVAKYILPTIWNLSSRFGVELLDRLSQESPFPVSSYIDVLYSCTLPPEVKFARKYVDPILESMNSDDMLTRGKSISLYVSSYSPKGVFYFDLLRNFLMMNVCDNNSSLSIIIVSSAVGALTKGFVCLLNIGFKDCDVSEFNGSLKRRPQDLEGLSLLANRYRRFFLWLYRFLYDNITNTRYHCVKMCFRMCKVIFHVFDETKKRKQGNLAVDILQHLCLSERALCCLLGALLSNDREIREDVVDMFKTYPQLIGRFNMNLLINSGFKLLTNPVFHKAETGVSILKAISHNSKGYCEMCMFKDLTHLLRTTWDSVMCSNDPVLAMKDNSLHAILMAIDELCPNEKINISVSLLHIMVRMIMHWLGSIVIAQGGDGQLDECQLRGETVLNSADFVITVNSMWLTVKACCTVLVSVYQTTFDSEILTTILNALMTVLDNCSHKGLVEAAGECLGTLVKSVTLKGQHGAFHALLQTLNYVLIHKASNEYVSTFRRAAEVRVILCAFTANDITVSKMFITAVLQSLLYQLQHTSRVSFPYAHANLLYYLDGVLKTYKYSFVFLQSYVVVIMELAVRAFAQSDFYLRNAALQLFATTTKLILGQKRKPVNEETTRHLSIEEFNYRLTRGEASDRAVLVRLFFDLLKSDSVEQLITIFSFLSQTFSRGPRIHRFPNAVTTNWKSCTAEFRMIANTLSRGNTAVADIALKAYVALGSAEIDVVERKINRHADKVKKYYAQNDLEGFKRSLKILKSYMEKDELGACKNCLKKFTIASYSNVAFEYILYDELDMEVVSEHFNLGYIRTLNSRGTRMNYKKRAWILANIKICLKEYEDQFFAYVLQESLKVKDYYLTNLCFAAVKSRISEDWVQRPENKKLLFDILFNAAIENDNFEREIFETVLMFLDLNEFSSLMSKAVLRKVYVNLPLPIKHINRSAFLYIIALKGTLKHVLNDSCCLKKIINEATQLCLNNLNKPLCNQLGLIIIKEHSKFGTTVKTELEDIETYLAIILFHTLLSGDSRIASEAVAVCKNVFNITDSLTRYLVISLLLEFEELLEWLNGANATQFLVYLHAIAMYNNVSTQNPFIETNDKVVEYCNTLRKHIFSELKSAIDHVADVTTLYKIVNWVVKNFESERLDHIFELLFAKKSKLQGSSGK